VAATRIGAEDQMVREVIWSRDSDWMIANVSWGRRYLRDQFRKMLWTYRRCESRANWHWDYVPAHGNAQEILNIVECLRVGQWQTS